MPTSTRRRARPVRATATVAPERRLDAAGRAALQRRTLRVLVGAQLVAAVGVSGAAGGALLAAEVSGRSSLASLPLALIVAGTALGALPASALSRRAGRRVGLATSLAVAAMASAGIVVAGAVDSFWLLCALHVPFGAGNAALLLGRYAAADLSDEARRARSMSRVVVAAAFGGVAGPNLIAPAGRLASSLGLSPLTGLYLVGAAAYALAALVLHALLRPDPLQLAAGLAEQRPGGGAAAPRRGRRWSVPAAAVPGLLTIAVSNFVMVAVMAMAPVHLDAHGHGLAVIGLVVSLHVAGMFGPAPVTGWLTDRAGAPAVGILGAALLAVGGGLAASGHGPTTTAGLVLLGIGWNAALLAGSSMLTAPVPLVDRPATEGAGELWAAVASGIATAAAGPLTAAAGYAALAGTGSVVAVGLGGWLALGGARRPGGLTRRSRPAPAAARSARPGA